MTDTSDTPDPALSGELLAPSDTSGVWLPPSAAALRLGVSERTLWRHVNAGRYHKRAISGRSEVFVPGSGAVTDNSATGSGLAVPATPDATALAILDELRRQHDATAERLTRQAEELRALAERAAAAEARAEAAERALRELRARRWWQVWRAPGVGSP